MPINSSLQEVKLTKLQSKEKLVIGQKEGKNKRKPFFIKDKNNKIVPLSYSIGKNLFNSTNQLEISYFDIKEIKIDIKKVWEEAKINYLKLDVQLSNKDNSTIEIRKPTKKILIKNEEYYVVKSSIDSHINWLSKNRINAIEKNMENISKYLKTKKVEKKH